MKTKNSVRICGELRLGFAASCYTQSAVVRETALSIHYVAFWRLYIPSFLFLLCACVSLGFMLFAVIWVGYFLSLGTLKIFP